MKAISIIFLAFLLTACPGPRKKFNFDLSVLNQQERKFFLAQDLDSTLVEDLREYTDVEFQAFDAFLFENEYLEEGYDAPILNGFVLTANEDEIYSWQEEFSDDFIKRGYMMIVLEEDLGDDEDLSTLAILKTRNKFKVLSQMGTAGYNYDIDNDSLIGIIKTFDQKYDLELTGASFDWCHFNVKNKNCDWKQFADELYAVCPDIVDQGTGTVEALADELEELNDFYMWWD